MTFDLARLGYGDLSLLSLYHKDPQTRQNAFITLCTMILRSDRDNALNLSELILNYPDESCCLKAIDLISANGSFKVLENIILSKTRQTIVRAAEDSLPSTIRNSLAKYSRKKDQIDVRLEIITHNVISEQLKSTLLHEAIELCVEIGEYKRLMDLSMNSSIPAEIRAVVEAEISNAISRMIFKSTDDSRLLSFDLGDVASNEGLSEDLRYAATVALVKPLEEEKRFTELIALASKNLSPNSQKLVKKTADTLAREIIDESFDEWKRKKEAKASERIILPWRGEEMDHLPQIPVSDEVQYLKEKYTKCIEMFDKSASLSLPIREHAAARIIEIASISGFHIKLSDYSECDYIPNNLRIFCGRRTILEDSKNLDNLYAYPRIFAFALDKKVPQTIIAESIAVLESNQDRVINRFVASASDTSLIKLSQDTSFSARFRMSARNKIEELQLSNISNYVAAGRYDLILKYAETAYTDTVRDSAVANLPTAIENYLTKVPPSDRQENHYQDMLCYFCANSSIDENSRMRAAEVAISNLKRLGSYDKLNSATYAYGLPQVIGNLIRGALHEAQSAFLDSLNPTNIQRRTPYRVYGEVKKLVAIEDLSQKAKEVLNAAASEQMISCKFSLDTHETRMVLRTFTSDMDLSLENRENAGLLLVQCISDTRDLWHIFTTGLTTHIKDAAAAKLLAKADDQYSDVCNLLPIITSEGVSPEIKDAAVEKQLQIFGTYKDLQDIAQITSFIDSTEVPEPKKQLARQNLYSVVSDSLNEMASKGYYSTQTISTAITASRTLSGESKSMLDMQILTIGSVAIEKASENGHFSDIVTFVDAENIPAALKTLGSRKLTEQLPLLSSERDFDTKFAKETHLYIKRHQTTTQPDHSKQLRAC